MKLFSVLLFAFLPCVSFAYDIKGFVVGTNNKPLDLVNVLLLQEDSTYIGGCLTDSTGLFEFHGLSNGNYILKFSSLGYDDGLKDFVLQGNSLALSPIVLTETSITLKGVVVKGELAASRLVSGGVQVSVANSSLRKEINPLDILRKIPGMTLSKGELQAFGYGKPVVYINGKKTQSDEEVKRLVVNDIKTVTLLTSPGVEYDSSGSPVLLIVTKRRENGFNFQLSGEGYWGKEFNHQEGIHLNYQQNGLSVFGSYQFLGNKTSVLNHTITGIQADTLWNYDSNETRYMNAQKHSYQIGLNYEMDPRHTVGVQYDGISAKDIGNMNGHNSTSANGKPYENMSIRSVLLPNRTNHHINTFYQGKWGAKTTFRVYFDYVNNTSAQDQNITETNLADNLVNRILMNSRSDFNVYSAKATLGYSLGEKSKLSIGGDYNYVRGINKLTAQNNLISDAASKNSEGKWAAFLAYNYVSEKLDISAGVKFERLHSVMDDFKNKANNIDRIYNNIFPSINLNYQTGEVSQSLNYSSSINRPDFDVLNTNVYYTNRFNYQIGNPSIKPAIWHTINYALRYRFLYFSLIYANAKDYIGYNFYADAKNPSVVVTSYTNYDNYQRFAAVLNLSHQIGFWEPTFSVYYMQPFFKMNYMGNKLSHNTPCFNIGLDNGFSLPWGLYFNAEYQFSSSNSYLMFKVSQTHVINLKLQKSFLKEQLQLTLYGNDLLNGNKMNMTGFMNTISFNQREIPDSRNIGLSVIFRFNNYKNRRDNQNSAQEAMDRLKVE